MASDLDVARKLLTPRFRGVAFHCGGWEFGLEHDHAQHKFQDRDGGLIEATGRAPSSFSFTAYFRNGIATAANGEPGLDDVEQYPQNWRKFVAACTNRSTGDLVHPELGTLKVKCKSCKTTFDPAKRDGVDVQVEFVESPVEDEELSALLKQQSPMGAALAEARVLDNATGNISPVPEYPESLSPNALESIKQLSGAFAQFKAGLGNIAAQFDAVVNAIGELRDSISDAGQESADAYKAIASCDKLVVALVEAASGASTKAKPVTQATVNDTATPDTVAGFFGTPLDDFLRMNPAVADKSFIDGGTQVFVFA